MPPRQPARPTRPAWLARLAASCLAVGAALAMVPPAAAQATTGSRQAWAPAITGLQVNADAGLAPGSTVDFTLRGTPGGTARVEALGTDLDLELREARPGVYEGRYTVRRADAIDARSRLRTSLTARGFTANAVYGFPPSFLAHQQARAAAAGRAGGTAGAGAAGAQASASAGDTAARAPRAVATPDVATPASPPPLRIERLAAEPAGPLQPGTVLRLTLAGTPGALASVAVPGLGELPMRELQPGQYVATHQVRPQDSTVEGPVVATLRQGERTVTAQLATPLVVAATRQADRDTTLGAGPARAASAPAPATQARIPEVVAQAPLTLQVTSPAPQSEVDAGRVVVRGRTAPQATVRAVVHAVAPPTARGLVRVARPVTQQALQADASGEFSFDFGPQAADPGTRYEVELTATEGDRSTPPQRLVLIHQPG